MGILIQQNAMDTSPTTRFTLLLLLVLSFLTLTSSSSRSLESTPEADSYLCNPHDYAALKKIYAALGYPKIIPIIDCCYGGAIECDFNTSRITGLFIFQDPSISGQIPDAVGDLPFLKNILFHHLPNLTGTIPSTITKLKFLTMFRVTYTKLSGPIPSFLSQIPNLDFLDLSFNQFSGSIPPSLSSIPKLTVLHLDRNMLTGAIPESFGKFKQPSFSLYLSHNQLTGEIPKSLGDLNFDTIDLGRNKLQGDASMLFKSSGSTVHIDLNRNMFEFDLSKVELNQPKKNLGYDNGLQFLDISHNKIFGSIPEGITGLDWQYLNVSYNQLCGKIPQGGRVQKFDSYSFFHNKCLCGSTLDACK